MKSRAKAKIEAQSAHAYEGYWNDEGFVITAPVRRKDLVDPSIKPSFIVYLTNGERILVGWTDKSAHRMFYIKEISPNPGTADDRKYHLKVIRMRGAMWRKTIKAVKRGMTKWFQDDGFDNTNALYWDFPFVRKIYPPLFANDIISVQPMQQPASLLFYLNFKNGKP